MAAGAERVVHTAIGVEPGQRTACASAFCMGTSSPPDGRVEGEDQATTNSLEGASSILRPSEKTENGLR
jgi:hypothetical protein